MFFIKEQFALSIFMWQNTFVKMTPYLGDRSLTKFATPRETFLCRARSKRACTWQMGRFPAKSACLHFWPHRLMARTPGSHPGNRGSTPLGATAIDTNICLCYFVVNEVEVL